ncbi:MAG: ketoacyl-ACP synthase III [Candidatus Eisenbacteria bacterium]|uniref:Beta-ketoacyl-[acyl-carrier-protein] synthase III n=1 Tax=Eiseniibacteriota bacterium TaxID=2212470 RepID=A0A956LYK6_UNCEI|nr:ketoacyl-ACP synthase III [Candidatus Eisenbacteria bacterium]
MGREVRILGTGSCVPDRVLTNQDLERMVDTSDEWIVTRTGIKERRIVGPDMAASDLAEVAGARAMKAAGITPTDLDAIFVCTVTGDHLFPSTSCLLQARFGAPQAFCMDVSAACSGFLYGCETASAFIASGMAETVLVVGVEILSKFTNFEDRGTCVLFGDGAGAAVFGPGPGPHQILASHLGADGRFGSLIELPAGGSRRPMTHEALEARQQYLTVKGNEVFKLGVRGMADACIKVLDQAGLAPDDVDLLIPHQANLRIIDATAKRLEIPPERVVVNIDRYGNTSAASVPIALDEAVTTGRVHEGDLVLMVVFGGGLTWGATLVRW